MEEPDPPDHRGRPVFHPTTRAEWRAWLAEHHATSNGIWLARWRRSTGRPILPYDDIIDEALCFGWIDSTLNVLGDERSAVLFTPRKPKSTWSRRNKVRVERLLADGAMTPAGLAVVEAARGDGSWNLLDDVEALIEPDDLGAALDASPAARAAWDRFSPSTRKQLLWWVTSAKRPETRRRRIDEVVHEAAHGRPASRPG